MVAHVCQNESAFHGSGSKQTRVVFKIFHVVSRLGQSVQPVDLLTSHTALIFIDVAENGQPVAVDLHGF